MPSTYFRFNHAMNTLMVQLCTSSLSRRTRDFHPLERAHGAQTTKGTNFFTVDALWVAHLKDYPFLIDNTLSLTHIHTIFLGTPSARMIYILISWFSPCSTFINIIIFRPSPRSRCILVCVSWFTPRSTRINVIIIWHPPCS